jgi:metal-responsive CopG/Arc/MetJ family transcriptional regulator
MASVKTALSLQKSLLDDMEAISQQMNISPSQLAAIALEEFVDRYQSRQMLEQINTAYADAPDQDEQKLLRGMRRHQRQILENDS